MPVQAHHMGRTLARVASVCTQAAQWPQTLIHGSSMHNHRQTSAWHARTRVLSFLRHRHQCAPRQHSGTKFCETSYACTMLTHAYVLNRVVSLSVHPGSTAVTSPAPPVQSQP